MIGSLTFFGESKSPRLEPSEAELLCAFLARLHDHTASIPAQPVWWERLPAHFVLPKIN
jgi:hypothetical protein